MEFFYYNKIIIPNNGLVNTQFFKKFPVLLEKHLFEHFFIPFFLKLRLIMQCNSVNLKI